MEKGGSKSLKEKKRMKNRNINKITASILIAIIIATSFFNQDSKQANASTIYITVEDYAKALAKELGLKSIEGEQSSGYVNALIKEGIIKKGDVTDYKKDLTRTDAMVFLNRADEYLYGETLEEAFVQLALEKRISDISKIKTSKRKDVVKAYLKGYIKGYSNGTYSTTREIRGGKKITKSGALSCMKLLKDKSLRAQISPDGQLIRTTKLPVYAERFPYILASYPNEYYDLLFHFEYTGLELRGKKVERINLEDYANPVDVKKAPYRFSSYIDERVDTWVEKAKAHLNVVFNVDYRTIDDSWIDSLLEVDNGLKVQERWSRVALEEYVTGMKKNKTILESSSIDVDRSSLYFSDGLYYLRAHIRFRINSSVASLTPDIDSLISKRLHNDIIFSVTFVNFDGMKLGEWYDGYFEITLGSFGTGDLDVSYMKYDYTQQLARKVKK